MKMFINNKALLKKDSSVSPSSHRVCSRLDGDIWTDSDGKTWLYREGVADEKLDYDVNENIPNRERFHAYKMFVTKYNPNNKRTYKEKGRLYPLYINAKNYYEIGPWYKCGYGASQVLIDEFTHEPIYDKNGKLKVKTYESSLAFRPGGHSGGLPLMRHRGRLDLPHVADNDFDYFHSQEVFAEIEFSGHYDYTDLSKKRQAESSNPDDPYEAGFTDIEDINKNGMGYYRFKTSTNASPDEAWFIASAFRIIRVIDDAEMNNIIDDYNSKHGTNFKAQMRGAPNGKNRDKFNADFTQFNSSKQIDVDKAFDKVSEFSRNPLKGFSDFTDEMIRKGFRAVTTPVKIETKKSDDKDKTDEEEYMKELNRKSEEFIKTNGKVNSSLTKGWKSDLIKSSNDVSKQKEFKQRCDDVADNWEEYQESMEYPVEDSAKPSIHSSKITSANDYGWEVNANEADTALDMWIDVVGEEQALEDIAKAQGENALEENLKYIFRNYDLDYKEFESVWDGYDYLMDIIGPEEFLSNLSKAMGTDELSEALAFIFRMNDFEDWKEYKLGEAHEEISNGMIKSEYETEEDNRTIEHVPQYAVAYMMYGEPDGNLTDEDIETIDNFMSRKGIGTITGTVEGTENEFDNNPAFGLPTSTVTVTY